MAETKLTEAQHVWAEKMAAKGGWQYDRTTQAITAGRVVVHFASGWRGLTVEAWCEAPGTEAPGSYRHRFNIKDVQAFSRGGTGLAAIVATAAGAEAKAKTEAGYAAEVEQFAAESGAILYQGMAYAIPSRSEDGCLRDKCVLWVTRNSTGWVMGSGGSFELMRTPYRSIVKAAMTAALDITPTEEGER